LLKEEADCRGKLDFTPDELACSDAVSRNDSAVFELGDDTSRKIAHELTDIVCRHVKTDSNVTEQVLAKLRATICRLLLRDG
jgi:type I restriction enzyme R subunit